jgi:hypothetical protein
MVSLVKLTDGWLVSYLDEFTLAKHYPKFTAIEPAADFLIGLGVDTDAIDDALIILATNENLRRVNFSKDGKVYNTDVI